MTRDQLIDWYYEYAMDGPALIPFVAEVLKGRYGIPERQPLLLFLDQIEKIVLGNIETRFDEGPGLESDPDAAAEETRHEINDARSLVLHTLPR